MNDPPLQYLLFVLCLWLEQCFCIHFPAFSGRFDANLADIRGLDQKLRDTMGIQSISLDSGITEVLNSRFQGEKNKFEMVFSPLKVLISVKK